MADTKLPQGSNNTNFWQRFLVGALGLVLVGLALISFFKNEPPYTISAELITVLVLAIVLALSETYDNFSVGKLFSLSREIRQEKETRTEVESENRDLRAQILSITANLNQNQSNTTIHGVPITPEFLHSIGVVPATKADTEEETEEEIEKPTSAAVTSEPAVPADQAAAKTEQPAAQSGPELDFRKLPKVESLVLERYLEKAGLPTVDLMQEIRFTKNFSGLDPIMEREIRFDGYLRHNNKEYFFEVARGGFGPSPMLAYRLYVMLVKILAYKNAKDVDAELRLIFYNLPDIEENERQKRHTERFFEWFEPAIRNNLLRVDSIELTDADKGSFRERREKSK